jgi:hypothetical protein
MLDVKVQGRGRVTTADRQTFRRWRLGGAVKASSLHPELHMLPSSERQTKHRPHIHPQFTFTIHTTLTSATEQRPRSRRTHRRRAEQEACLRLGRKSPQRQSPGRAAYGGDDCSATEEDHQGDGKTAE